MHSSILSKSSAINALCRQYGVKSLEVFGSAARGVDFNPETSDADFLVEFVRPALMRPLEEYFGFKEAMTALLGREVDLIERGVVRNPYLMRNIDQTRELVYAS